MDTAPLHEFLERALPSEQGALTGIEENLRRGTLKAVGISTTSYGSGSSVVWIQGDARLWQRPQRQSVLCRLGINHIMVSAALPIFFPAVRIGRGLLERLPEESLMGLEVVKLLVVRPRQDLGRLARQYEPDLPRAFRFLTRGLGTRQTRSPEMLSMLMFQADYLNDLMEIGEADAEVRGEEIAAFIEPALDPVARLVPRPRWVEAARS